MRLLRRLLSWNPSHRPTAKEALLNAYFTRAPSFHHHSGTGAASSSNHTPGGGIKSDGPAGNISSTTENVELEAASTAQSSSSAAGERLQQRSMRRSRSGGRGAKGPQDRGPRHAIEAEVLRWEQDVLQACGSIPRGQKGWC